MVTMNNSSTTIEGPAGDLEVMMERPRQQAAVSRVAVIGHPHPLMEGTMHNKVVHSLARYYRDQGLVSVRFNFRGVGKSQGEHAQGAGEVEDFITVCQWAAAQYPNAAFDVAGFSFGSYVALAAARSLAQQGWSILSVLLVAPPIERMAFEALSIESPLRKVPLVVVQGDVDEVVSAQQTVHWFENWQGIKRLFTVSEAGHFFHSKLATLKAPVEACVNQDWVE